MSKKLIELIQKRAQAAQGTPPPAQGTPPAAAAPKTVDLNVPDAPGITPAGKPKPKGVAPGVGGMVRDPRILKMQEQMQTLSKWVLSQINIADIAKQDSLREAGEAAHRGSFGDFIVKNYLRPSDKGAREFDPSKNVTDVSKKQPSTPTRMYTIMDTIARIGGGAAEDAPDGKWGQRTNQALLNIRAFAKAMLKLAADFGVKIESYNQADLNQLNGLPENDTDWTPQKKGEMAPVIGQHIRAITNMFHEIKENILENPQHQAFIEGDSPYATIGKGKPGTQPKAPEQPLSPQAIAAMQSQFKDGFPVLFTDPRTNKSRTTLVFVPNLVSPEAFQAWMYKNQTGQDAVAILDQVKSRIAGRPITAVPLRYEDTLSPTDREQFFKRNPDMKKQYEKDVAQENADQSQQEKELAQQRAEMSGKAGA